QSGKNCCPHTKLRSFVTWDSVSAKPAPDGVARDEARLFEARSGEFWVDTQNREKLSIGMCWSMVAIPDAKRKSPRRKTPIQRSRISLACHGKKSSAKTAIATNQR